MDNWMDYNSKTKTICWKGVVILTIDMPLEEFIYTKVVVKTFNNIFKFSTLRDHPVGFRFF